MNARDFARCIELAFNGTKSAYPAMQPVDAFLRDFSIMVRTLVAGAVSPSPKPRTAKTNPAKKSARQKSGDRK
jgi:TetR/AcrR family acrAB operon transcriptional repressor